MMTKNERLRILKYLVVEGLTLLAAVYLVASIVAFLAGGADSGYANKYSKDLDQCFDTPLRIELALPAYRLGCFVFGPQDSAYDYFSLEELNERRRNQNNN